MNKEYYLIVEYENKELKLIDKLVAVSVTRADKEFKRRNEDVFYTFEKSKKIKQITIVESRRWFN